MVRVVCAGVVVRVVCAGVAVRVVCAGVVVRVVDDPLPSLQYIQQLIRKDYKDIEAILVPPSGQDETVWKYEHLR